MNHRHLTVFAASLLLTLCGLAYSQQGIGWHFDMMRGSGGRAGIDWSTALVLDYTITNGASIILPIEAGLGKYDFKVDWGDGTTSVCTGQGASATHTYLSGDSNRNVKMLGKIYSIRQVGSGGSTGMKGVSQWGSPTGNNGPGLAGAFNARTSLKYVSAASDDTALWSGITSFDFMFYDCSSLTNVSSLPNCPSNTSLQSMFFSATSLKNVAAGAFKNPTSITNANYTFYNCPALTNFYDISGFTNLVSVQEMYTYASSIKTINCDLSGLTKVDKCFRMFDGCTALSNTPSIQAFSNCTSLENMWNNCPKLTNASTLNGFIRCISIDEMFSGDVALKWRPDISSMSSLTNAFRAFSGCTTATGSLQYVVGDCAWITGQLKNVSFMFNNNYSMSGTAQPFVTAITNSPGYPTGYTITSCFTGCTNLSDYATIPAAFK